MLEDCLGNDIDTTDTFASKSGLKFDLNASCFKSIFP